MPRHLSRRREPIPSTVVPAIIRATIQNERTGPRKIAGERQQHNAKQRRLRELDLSGEPPVLAG
jgi:hypothetical protein